MYHSRAHQFSSTSRLERLQAVFTHALGKRYRTLLIGGADEPLYQPAANAGDRARIYFTRDYFASALHEVAHWCVAGEARRKLPDYGYWYAPDGRDQAQQKRFEQVEIVPQALEWIFSVAAGERFHVSVDNLESQPGASAQFKQAIVQQARQYCRRGLPARAAIFASALAREFVVMDWRDVQHFQVSDI